MIRFATNDDLEFLSKYDHHINRDELFNSITLKRIIILEENNLTIGWLRYNLFWDNTPFMNMLYILDGYRMMGYGNKVVNFWEIEMKKMGYNLLMTSTQANENAKHFYRKLGYSDVGGFTPFNEEYEIILMKKI